MSLLGLALWWAASLSAQTYVIGDAVVGAELLAGTTTASARVTVVMSSTATSAFRVSGVDETPFFQVDRQSRLGLSLEPQAHIDVYGVADSSDTGVQVRNGNLFPATAAHQLTFGYNGKNDLRHAIRTSHQTAVSSSSIQFLLWSPSVSTTAVGTLQVLALQTTNYGASVHVNPGPELADADLVISSGTTLGGGYMLSASESGTSSRTLKEHITPLGQAEESLALDDISSLKHARFRYRRWGKKGLVRDPSRPLLTGLIYEDAPQSVKRRGSAISFDERLAGLELGLKELQRRLEAGAARAEALK